MTTRRRSKFPLGLLALRTAVAWAVALLLVFPLAWLFLTAFKTELQAIAVPPLFVFTPTLENFHEVQERSDYLLYAKNSVITSVLCSPPCWACCWPRQPLTPWPFSKASTPKTF